MRSQAKAASAGSNLRRSGAARLVLLCLPALLLAPLFAAPAQAAPETIAEFGDDAGQVDFPNGAAVDRSSGDIYITDRNNFRIDKFDSDGNFLMAWGFGVADGSTAAPQTCGPEATPPTSRCFGGLFASGAGSVAPDGVAVDQSSGAVYVAEGNPRWRVSKFTSSGEFVFMVGRNVNETKVAEGGATQAEKNICTAASGDTCGAGEAGTGPNEFSAVVGESTFGLAGVAVDSAGVVWVGSLDRLSSFDATGVPGAEIALPGAGLTQSLAFDSADNFYVISELLPGVRKLEAGTGALLETLDAGGKPRTVTLDEDDFVYTGDCVTAEESCFNSPHPYRFKIYNPSGEQVSQFGVGQVIGGPGAGGRSGGNALAVDKGAGKLYAASSEANSESVVQAFPLPEPGPLVESQGVEDILPTTATLTANLNPEGHETTYHFEYGTTTSYGLSTPTQTLPGTGFDSEAVQAALSGLIPDTTYHFRLVATNHCNDAEPIEVCTAEGEDQTFTTLPAVEIGAQWATDVTSTSAILHAELDPLGVDAEAWLEYGTSESYGHTVPLANLGDGFGVVTRQASLIGLQSGTTYHYRFVARDERDGATYTVQGADKAFITEVNALGFELPDNRAWEMVSRPNKHGAILLGAGPAHIQAAQDGNGLAYLSASSIEPHPEGLREPASILARRLGSSWSSKDISPPNSQILPPALGQQGEYKLFSSDLSEALLDPRDGTNLSPEASERAPHLRQNTNSPTYRPLVTGKEGFANVPPGTVFGGGGSISAVTVLDATPDLDHVVLRSAVPLLAGAPSDPTVYRWSDGQLEPISVLPADEGGAIVAAPYTGAGTRSLRNAISEDGSRVFWSTRIGDKHTALYLRDMQAEESVKIDVQSGGSGAGEVNPIFQGASADGSVVFFTDTKQLTAGASPSGADLYRCEIPLGTPLSGCSSLTNLTTPSPGESAEVQGIVSALSEDGSRAYFVAEGDLEAGPNQLGHLAIAGEPNLYLWQEGEGLRFIATLAAEDRPTWGFPGGSGAAARAAALGTAISPSGRYFAFMSQLSPTDPDRPDAGNVDVTSGEAVEQVFRYDALTERLECVSCAPTGATPRGTMVTDLNKLVDPRTTWQDRHVAASLPEAVALDAGGGEGPLTIYQPRALFDNGRVFFNAIDSLVPADSNGEWDVYQHEPTGVGDCSAASGGASISRSAGGCVSLISSGTGEEETGFLDASATGDDVFFLTPARLSVLDEDEELDVYDARVNGVAATLPPNNECLGEACQPAVIAPSDPTPASAGFRGQGDPKPNARKRCAKGKRLVRRKGKARCVVRKQARKGKAARKAGKSRRASR